MKKERNKNPIQPVSGTKVPRFAGPSTFARLPELRDVESCDVAIVGIPFDAGTSYRPGARFGPQSIRQASRHLRTNYHPNYDVEPFKIQQVADAGDIACNPFSIDEAIKQIEIGATDLLNKVGGIISLGGDHTIAVPLLILFIALNKGKAIVWSPPKLIIPPTLFKSSKAPSSTCFIASSILKGLQVISPASATCWTLNGSTS